MQSVLPESVIGNTQFSEVLLLIALGDLHMLSEVTLDVGAFIICLVMLQVVSGNRADAMTVLLDVEDNYSPDQTLRGEEKPKFVVRSMSELAELLQTSLQLEASQ